MYHRRICKALFFTVFLVLLMGYTQAQTVQAVVKAVDLNPKIASGQFVQRVDTFMVIFDATFSMNGIYKGASKLSQQKKLVALLDDTIPNVKLTGAIRTFGRFMEFNDATSKDIFWAMNYSKPGLTKIVEPYTMGEGDSPLDIPLNEATIDLWSQPGRMALIVFSDGEDMDKAAPVAAAKKMKKTYGNRICIYTVHIGDDLKGRGLMKEIADAGECGFMVTGDSISTPAGMAAFVEKIFLEVKREEPKPAPPPPPPPQVEEMKKAPEAATEVEQKLKEKGRVTLLVEFDFDKAVVKPQYHKEIEKVTDVMKKYPDLNIVVEGHTDNIGTKKYNEGLSQRRAEAIREVMVKKFGIDSSRIKAMGYGFSRPIASNATREGRQHNRRVEAAVEYNKQK